MARMASTSVTFFALIVLLYSASAEGRFLQTDPVGYQAGPNLYTYVGNDPTNKADPLGMFANVNVWDDGEVDINVPIQLNNQSSDANAAGAAAQSIQSKWTGQFGAFNVKTTVTSVSSTQNKSCGCANVVTITDAPTPSATTPNGTNVGNGGHSYVVGDYEGHWTTGDTQGKALPIAGSGDKGVASKKEDTFAHEGGHLMNVPDESGNQGHLMDQGPGRAITEQNIKSITSSPGNTIQHCVRSTGQCQ